MRRTAVVLGLGALLALQGTSAVADTVIECTALQIALGECTARGGGGGGGGQDGDEQEGPRPVSNAPYRQKRYVPACGTNTLSNGGDAMCVAATALCDTRGEAGSTAFWVWSRLYRPGVPEDRQDAFEREPGYECRGATEDGVPGIVQVYQEVLQDFERFVFLKGSVRTDPGAEALINVDTLFSTSEDAPVALPPVTLTVDRAYTVNITITPESYTWRFGDGTTLVTTSPGRPLQKDVTHRYTAPGEYQTRVDIAWSGTFSVDGGETVPVQGRVTTVGAPTPLSVRTAGSELVAR